jgi:hypothetical protein
MKIVKHSVKKALKALGYEIRRSANSLTTTEVSFDNFLSLVRAYEQRLNEDENLILPNEMRPKLLARLLGTPPAEAYFLLQALARCKDVPGDVCEFGAAHGATSALIAKNYHYPAISGSICLTPFKDSRNLLIRTN